MIEVSKFRTAVGGFNRTDVVGYIESMSMEHQKEVRKYQDEAAKLTAEKTELQNRLEQAEQELSALRESDEALQEQVNSLAQEAAEAYQRCTEAEQQLQELRAEEPEEEPEEGEEPELPLCDQELIAYRRAEQTERNAIQRANKIYAQIEELTDNARSRYLDSGDDIAALTEDLKSGFERLQDALAELQVIFDDTTSAFEAMELPTVQETEE